MNSDQKNIGSGTIYQYTGSTSALITGVIFYIYIIKVFNPVLFATIGICQSILLIVSTFFNFGLNQTLQHYISHLTAREESGQTISLLKKISPILLVLSLGSFFTIFFSSPFLISTFLHMNNENLKSSVKLTFLTLAIASNGYLLSNVLNGILLGYQKYKISGIITILKAILSNGIAVIMVTFYGTAVSVILSWSFAYYIIVILEVIAVTILTTRSGQSLKPFELSSIFKYSMPILFASFITLCSVYADRLIVAALLDQTMFATYSFVILIVSSVTYLVSPIYNIILPKFSELYSRNKYADLRTGLRTTINVSTFIYTPVALLISVLASQVITFVGHRDYIGGSTPLAVILIVSSIFVSNGILIRGLQAIRVTHIFIYTGIFSLLANLVLTYKLIPVIGLLGASIGYSSISFIDFAVLYWFGRLNKIVSFDISTLSKIWFASLCAAISVLVFSSYISLNVLHFTWQIYVILFSASGLLCLTIYAFFVRILKIVNPMSIDKIYSYFPSSLLFTKKIFILIFVSKMNK